MKKTTITFVASFLVLLALTPAAGATSATATKVQSLALAESEVLTLLHEYSDTTPWKAAYRSAIASQQSDLSTLNADLSLVTTSASRLAAFYIPSQSMEPDILPGDRVLVDTTVYRSHAVHSGDILIFRRPPNDTTPGIDDLIKRVIALPGQSIYVANCTVYINGKELAQPYLPMG